MNAHVASLINALTLIALGGWGYFESGAGTALIPVVGGLILVALNSGVKKENKVIAHIAVVLTLILLIGLFKPLMGAIADGRTMAIVRVSIMLLTAVLAKVYFVKSFIDARKKREAEGN